jgi:hypothetical protein
MTELNIMIYPTKLREGSVERDVFVAVALEHFLVAQGETAKEAGEQLQLLIEGTINANQLCRQGLGGIAPAPKPYQDRFQALVAAGVKPKTDADIEGIRSVTYSQAA